MRGLLPRSADLWVKREDRAASLYGGNKVRKLELLLADAIARGKKRVAAIGGWGSHHALATALFARERGLGCDLHLFPQPMNEHVREQLRADLAAGARVHAAASLPGILPSVLGARMSAEVAWLAPGGSSPLGSLGWVSAADEIIEQVARGELPAPDVVYVALGSCGTVAGLLAGFRKAAFAPELVGVRVVERPVSGLGPTRALEERTLALLDEDASSPGPFRVEHAQIRASLAAQPRLLRCRRCARPVAAGVGLELEATLHRQGDGPAPRRRGFRHARRQTRALHRQLLERRSRAAPGHARRSRDPRVDPRHPCATRRLGRERGPAR